MRNNLANGCSIKIPAVVDEYTQRYFRIEVDTSINGVRVARTPGERG